MYTGEVTGTVHADDYLEMSANGNTGLGAPAIFSGTATAQGSIAISCNGDVTSAAVLTSQTSFVSVYAANFAGTITANGGASLIRATSPNWDYAHTIGTITGTITDNGGSLSVNADATMAASINGSGLSSVSVTSGYSDVTGNVNVTSGDVYVDAPNGTISGQISNTGGSMEVSAKTINTSISTTGGSLTAGATRDIAGTISDHGGDINSIAAGGSITATISDTGGNIIPPLYTNGPSISAGEDLSGSITDTGGNILGVNIGRSVTSAGSLIASSGSITNVTVGGNLSGSLEADGGQIDGVSVGFLLGQISAATLGSISATADLDGNISATSGGISELSADRDFGATVTSAGVIDDLEVGRDMTGGSVDAMGIGSLGVGRDMTTSVTATQNIGPVTVGRTLSGSITASSGYIQSVDAGDNWGGYDTKAGNINGSTISAGTYVGDVTAAASPGFTGAMTNVTITANNGSIGEIEAETGMTTVTATASGSIGDISTTTGSITGSFTATNGSIGSVQATYGSLSAPLTAGATIGSITVENDIDKAIHAGGTIGNVTSSKGTISGDITSTGGSVGNVTASTGSISGAITSTLGSIGNITTGDDLRGDLTAGMNIGNIAVAGEINSDIDAQRGSVGTINAKGQILGSISSLKGDIRVTAGDDMSATILGGIAPSVISVYAGGDISGNVQSNGTIVLDAVGEVLSNQVAASGNIDVIAGKDIYGFINSERGGVTALAGGIEAANITSYLETDFEGATAKGTVKGSHQINGGAPGGITTIISRPDSPYYLPPANNPNWAMAFPPTPAATISFSDAQVYAAEAWNRYVSAAFGASNPYTENLPGVLQHNYRQVASALAVQWKNVHDSYYSIATDLTTSVGQFRSFLAKYTNAKFGYPPSSSGPTIGSVGSPPFGVRYLQSLPVTRPWKVAIGDSVTAIVIGYGSRGAVSGSGPASDGAIPINPAEIEDPITHVMKPNSVADRQDTAVGAVAIVDGISTVANEILNGLNSVTIHTWVYKEKTYGFYLTDSVNPSVVLTNQQVYDVLTSWFGLSESQVSSLMSP